MTTFAVQDVLNICAEYGPSLRVPAGLDPVKVMTAISAVETGGGDVRYVGNNCGPRHEPAYEAGGAHWAQAAMAPLLAEYPPVGNPPQSPAACSYGPWQMMFLNFSVPIQQSIIAGTVTLDDYASEFVRWFNSFETGKRPQNLDQVGEIWNAGHITPDPAYTNKLEAAYAAI